MLDKRLKAAAFYVRKNARCVDVGTDHAYLAVYLYENKITEHIIACDINEKPLNAARKTIAEHNLTDKIMVVLSNGLENIQNEKAEDIIICGMGGELIMEIISASPYTKSKEKHFILQPMTNIPFLRKALYKNGYEIISETPVSDKNHIYTVMLVEYTGKIQDVSEVFSVLGKIPESDGEETKKYIKHQYQRQKKIAEGLCQSSDKSELAFEAKRLADEIKVVLEEM